MKKLKMSGPAIFMNSVIAATVLVSTICFVLYYGNILNNGLILWVGIVAFMIMYHFWLRIIMGNVTKLFKLNPNHWWYRENPFEKKLYKLLRVRKWKDKTLTYNPDAFSMEKHTLDEIVLTMTKAETDHWINEIISLTSMLFSLIWGHFWIFLVTAIAAMIFDAQFILIQRFNRPIAQRIIRAKKLREKQKA